MKVPSLLKCFIDGEAIAPEGGERFQDINPASGEVLCEVASATPTAIDAAVDSARRAQKAWIAMPAAERGRVLHRVAAILRDRKMELARLEVQDAGKP
ncbi:MAG: aldehyde dehydrogenase family protein, partial [Rhizobiales bacterium]|nr:aldehyde dehydrogenase family protein [Hyphomicrobiales bacterium]